MRREKSNISPPCERGNCQSERHCRVVPEEHLALYIGGDDGQGDADECENEDGGEEGGHVEVAVRDYYDAAEATVAAEPLAYYHSGQKIESTLRRSPRPGVSPTELVS